MECKTSHDWGEKMIHRKFYKKLKLGQTMWKRWFPKNCTRGWNLTVLPNICTNQNPPWKMRHKILRDFRIQTDHLISARTPDWVTIDQKKETWSNSGLCRPDGPRIENQRKPKERQTLKPCQRTKKLWNMKVTVIPIIIGLKRLGKGTWRGGNRRTCRDHPNYSITLLRSAKILRRVLETWRDLLSLRLQ